MQLSLDTITLAVADPAATAAFHAAAFAAGVVEPRPAADLPGTLPAEPAGFPGYVVSYILRQPNEVEAVLASAVEGGATVLKPAKKSLFAGFSAVLRAPDGSIWKLASASRKDKGPAADPLVPTETAVLLGVREPKATKEFYEALGMRTDRDYGNKYLDFLPREGAHRFGLMTRGELAKDAGVAADTGPGADGSRGLLLGHDAESREQVDALLATAAEAGGRVVEPAAEAAGDYAGHLADPDGNVWRVRSSVGG